MILKDPFLIHFLQK